MAATVENPAIPKGSLVLVTGTNGFIGSAIAHQFMLNGYKVRGTARDPFKSAWARSFFDETHGVGRFELVQVADLTADDAYDEAIKGVSAVVHVASDVSFHNEPNQVIPGVISGTLAVLKAAYSEPSVKRFVLTSSSSAVQANPTRSDTGPVVITRETWNELDVEKAWAPPPYEAHRGWAVYAASKTQGEQALWKYHRENQARRPDLVVNSVLPDLVYGRPLDVKGQGFASTSSYIRDLWENRVTPAHQNLGSQHFIDIEDVALLHLAAALMPDVQDERIFGFAGPYSWNDVLDIMRKHAPERELPANLETFGFPNEVQPRARAEELLRRMGRPGWKTLEECVLSNIE